MITKKELVRIIAKKAAIADTSAKELFDLFLRKIATELQPGDSAQFSNVGYFHFRKGKVKKEATDPDGSRIEYLDLIIFSTSQQLDIKSAGDLIFSVPDAGGGVDNLDAHFSLSVGKPVLPNLAGSKSAAYSTDELQEILNRKVENLMVNLYKDETTVAASEILLVDVKVIDQDQYELELEENTELNLSPDADDTIHSSEQLKSIAWSFGKDLSNQIEEPSHSEDDKLNLNETEKPSESEFKDKEWIESLETTDKKPDAEFEIEEALDEPGKAVDFTETAGEQTIVEHNEQDIIEFKDHELNKEIFYDNPDELQELTDNDINESIDADKIADKLMDDVDLSDLEIEMDDFEVSDNDEKMGKFERIRSISSSHSEEKSLKDIEGFDNFIDDKIDIGKDSIINKDDIKDIDVTENKFKPVKLNKPKKEPKLTPAKPTRKKELKLNRVDLKKSRRQYDRKTSGTKFLIILLAIAGVIGVIYLLTQSKTDSELYESVTITQGKSGNTTYIERSYDVPVNYPYEKSQEDLKIEAIKTPTETSDIKPKNNNVTTQPPVENVGNTHQPPVVKSGFAPPGTPVQAAYNIIRYNNKFVVQVASFLSQEMAKNEEINYASLGYNAFIERAVIDGKAWYRVRVGNFNSLETAKQFRKSQQ